MDRLYLEILSAAVIIPVTYAFYQVVISPRLNPLRSLAGPPIRGWFQNHLYPVSDPSISPQVHKLYVNKYGRSIRIQGLGPWDVRLLTLDPVSVAHVLKNSTIYEKPWQSRRLITSLIGCGMLAAEGHTHKRQRRVATPAFSVQNMRALVPVVFSKGRALNDKWLQMAESTPERLIIDVCHWISRATFDVIGHAGFDYDFNAIENESNELFSAYKEMFEVAVSQGNPFRTIFSIYAPFLSSLFPDSTVRVVQRSQDTIRRVAGHLIQAKKAKIVQGLQDGVPYAGRDLLSLLLKSNMATDLPPDQRISDTDILHNINTFMFAGSDTSSLSLTWTLLLLAQHHTVQERLRDELQSVAPTTSETLANLTEDEIQSLYEIVSNLPFLDNVIRESIRLIPPVHSSIRVAMQDDEVPVSTPVRGSNGEILPKSTITVPKGSFVHVAVEGFNLDKEFWGEDAWEFVPDRWDHLPESASNLPGLFSNTLTFSAGPRSCIGLRFSMIEIKTFLYILLTNFKFETTPDKIMKANVVLTRPYVSGKFREGSQCPLIVLPLRTTGNPATLDNVQ
ncbi:Cytochrome P450 monooxygenase 215 [Psilocybe cubensis]|uniref:Cytochrome P450 monooxygenase 215 n=2 Tax=Psilocybe cubensis TaxID=181762 RepID=A0ACB8HDW5_PSICU|nr:Cytochrome P450 monooxygenase 215 [Psilocybe cubensis]KAH9485345.1 Cytochrome P450 monooxygenase 215 [Psilocybe cubensis]